jgi:alpha-D-ribose 1-methylphosphonate 5-triphosphate synthase subunit PhnG
MSKSHADRQAWMRILALSAWNDIRDRGDFLSLMVCEVIRPPETGLVMLRGRMGGSGDAFNFGEATVTRCAVRSAKGHEGHAYVMGRNHAHAQTAAICDALMQDATYAARITSLVLNPLAEILESKKRLTAQKAAKTRVDFFTVARGENE